MALSDRANGFKLSLVLNHRCNLRCTYCYTGRKFDRAMPDETARAAIDLGWREAGQRFLLVAFFGGEPLLEIDRIERAVAYAHEAARGRELFFSIATNGTRVDERALALFRAHRFHVQVSLDGTAAAHDANRRFADGGPSQAPALSALQRLVAAGLGPTVTAVVDPANVAWLGESFELLADTGVRYVQLAPNHRARWDDAACDALERALHELGDRFVARLRAGRFVQLDPIHEKVMTRLRQGERPPGKCAFGRNELAVAPTGRLYPCDRLVGEDDRDDLCLGDLARGVDETKRAALSGASRSLDEECERCELRDRCATWCGCANYESTGDAGRMSPLQCWFERCFIAEADRVATTLFEERNVVFLGRYYAGR